MSPAAASPLAERELELESNNASALIPQPERPRLPIQVPVVADLGGSSMPAAILGSTSGVLLVQGHLPRESQPPLGTPVRLRLEWDRQHLSGRLAAHGVGGRFLVALGERPIRRSRRFNVDLAASLRSGHLAGGVQQARVRDLSSGGARVEGIQLPIGADVELHFTPPDRSEPIAVLGFVVRLVERDGVKSIGVAFRLGQASIGVLAGMPRPTPPPSAAPRTATGPN